VPIGFGSGPIKVSVGNLSSTSSTDFIYEWTGIVTIIAGGEDGYADGTGTAAQFSHPSGLDIDAAGNLYVADYNNSKVRKLTTAGVVTTFPGRFPNWNNPSGPNTDFGLPNDVAIDAAGNLFVAEFNSNLISRITPAGVVSVFSGSTNEKRGYADGPANLALFDWPAGITVDPSGFIYVVERNNHRVRKLTSTGSVSTLAGSIQSFADGTGTAARFNMPLYIASDRSGNLYVSDYFNNRIRKVTPEGVVTTIAGNGGYSSYDGMGTAATIEHPLDLAVDASGNIYVGDASNTIRWINPQGLVSSIKHFKTANGTPIQFSGMYGIAVNDNGIYVSDYYNNRICKVVKQ